MSFYTYRQNNSGGRFVFNYDKGISICVVVEADNSKKADKIAETVGLYFDGAGDCECCGNRWYRGEGEGEDTPCHYSDEEFITVSTARNPREGSMYPKTYAFVHYADGRIIGYKEPRER